MKPISPWFQTAALMSAIRNAICDLETARQNRSPNLQPRSGLELVIPCTCRNGKDHDLM
jgi:hypothetical protein